VALQKNSPPKLRLNCQQDRFRGTETIDIVTEFDYTKRNRAEMEIRGLVILDTFARKHPRARKSLDTWLTTVRGVDWHTPEDVRNTFNTVDYLRDQKLYCFNIGGNSYRLCAVVSFVGSFIVIEHIFTHHEYEKWNQKK
jgi:mRNA interferase HigB